MATRTKSSDANGSPKSSEAKLPAPGATKRSTSTGRARAAGKSAVGTSDTSTGTEPTTPDPSTPAATEGRRRTESSAKSKPGSEPEGDATPESGELITGASIVSVFNVGPFVTLALVTMPIDDARLLAQAPNNIPTASVVEGVVRDIAAIAEVDEPLASSSLAGLAWTLAHEMENPYNSATSKSMCARALLETMQQLRDLTPDGAEEGDELDVILGRSNESPLSIVK